MKYYHGDYLYKTVKVRDKGEELVDVKRYARSVIIKKSNLFGKDRGKILVRKTVAKMLDNVAGLLPKGYSLLILDGYRTEKTQRIYFLNYVRKLRKLHPDWSEKKLKRESGKYVANPETFAPHMSGGAVDVSLVKNKRQVVMGGFIGKKNSKISDRTKQNRKLLADAMTKAGFVNYPLEWWHWSFGDREWAAAKKRKFAIYDNMARG